MLTFLLYAIVAAFITAFFVALMATRMGARPVLISMGAATAILWVTVPFAPWLFGKCTLGIQTGLECLRNLNGGFFLFIAPCVIGYCYLHIRGFWSRHWKIWTTLASLGVAYSVGTILSRYPSWTDILSVIAFVVAFPVLYAKKSGHPKWLAKILPKGMLEQNKSASTEMGKE